MIPVAYTPCPSIRLPCYFPAFCAKIARQERYRYIPILYHVLPSAACYCTLFDVVLDRCDEQHRKILGVVIGWAPRETHCCTNLFQIACFRKGERFPHVFSTYSTHVVPARYQNKEEAPHLLLLYCLTLTHPPFLVSTTIPYGTMVVLQYSHSTVHEL